MHPHMHQVVKKLAHLSPERLEEVEDFIDFLSQRDRNKSLAGDFQKASEHAFNQVWDNDDDAAYDKL